MTDLKSSETARNLMRAFAGESQARNRYTFAAGLAKKEGLPVLEAIFTFTAGQERNMEKFFITICQNWQARPWRLTGVIR